VSTASCLVEIVSTLPDRLSMPIHSDVQSRATGFLQAGECIICIGLGPLERVSTSMTPNSVRPNVPVSLAPPLIGYLIAGNRVDPDLTLKNNWSHHQSPKSKDAAISERTGAFSE